MTPSLSAVIIARDEETDLPGCLESLKGTADEVVVVVDEATADGTEEAARRAGAKVLRRRFDDYAGQRQASLEAASGRWCLWIDADERLTPALAAEIKAAVARDEAAAYSIPFRVRFLGRELRWGGLGSERHVRLFRRDRARFRGAIHEGLEVDGPARRLSAPMLHEPYADVADYLSKLDRYTTLGARRKLAAGVRARPWHHLVGLWELFSRLVLRLGVLDGRAGLVWAGLSAGHAWLKYVKLEEMQRGERR